MKQVGKSLMSSIQRSGLFLASVLTAGIGTGFIMHDLVNQGRISEEVDSLEEDVEKTNSELNALNKDVEKSNTKLENFEDRFSSSQVISEGQTSSSEKVLTGNENFSVDGISFHLEKNLTNEGDSVWGLADLSGDVVSLETRRSVEGFYSTCVHEVVGHVRSDYRHGTGLKYRDGDEWVDRFEAEIVSPTCLKVLYRLDGEGSQ